MPLMTMPPTTTIRIATYRPPPDTDEDDPDHNRPDDSRPDDVA